MKRNDIHIIKLFALLTLFMIIWTGCSNDMEEKVPGTSETEGNYHGEPILIKASVSSIQEFNGIMTRSNRRSLVNVEPLDKTKDSGFDVVTTLEPIAGLQTRVNVPVIDTRFRIIAYKNNAIAVENYAGHGDYKIEGGVTSVLPGHELSIPADKYLFVCYSYGKTSDMPVFEPYAISVPVKQSEDFMIYTKSNVDVTPNVDGTFTVDDIQFARQASQVSVEVIAEGFGDNDIKVCKATISNMNDNKVTWPLKGNDLPLSGTSGSTRCTWSTLNKDTVISDKSIVLPITKRALTVTFEELEIGNYPFTNVTTTVKECEFTSAGNYKLSIKITRNYIEAGGYKWAKGNLYLDGNEYKFEANQEDYHTGMTGGSYFNWNVLTTDLNDVNTGNYSYAKDPCSKVVPEGTWQTPSYEQTLPFQNEYVWDADKKGAWLGGTDKLFLPAVGNRFEDDKVFGDGSSAYYSLRDFSQNDCWSMIIYTTPTLDWMDALPKHYGYPIRCVKR